MQAVPVVVVQDLPNGVGEDGMTPKKSPDGGHRGGWAPGLFQD